MFQLDMTGYTEPGLQAKVLNDYVDASLSQYVITILEEYTTLTHKLHNCGYGCRYVNIYFLLFFFFLFFFVLILIFIKFHILVIMQATIVLDTHPQVFLNQSKF